MKFTIETNVLQELINKASKGAANNKYIDFTNWVNIKAKDNVLTFITSDASNFFYVNHEVQVEDFDIIVEVALFNSIVNCSTTPTITLSTDENDNCLHIISNGDYTLPFPADAEFDDPLSEIELKKPTTTITKEFVNKMINVNKPSIAVTMQNPENTGYYVGDTVVTTDSKRITVLNEKVLKKPVLLQKNMVDLLSVIDEDNIDFYIDKKQIVFKTDKYTLFGYTLSGIEAFKIDAINQLCEEQIDSFVVFNKKDILDTLTRILLFVDIANDPNIILDFSKKELTISTLNKKNKEVVAYTQSEVKDKYSCKIRINTLMSQINSLDEELFTFYIGNDKLVKLTTDSIIQIIATTL